MKRGKDDEKISAPMFPRLHIKDTEKGGPRAPPRNKMALYEQLTIPSHRYNPGVVALNPSSNNNLVPTASTSQGTSRERSMYFPLYEPSSMLSLPVPANKLQIQHNDAIDQNNSLGQDEQRKKLADDDDFMVPIFSQSRMDQSNGTDCNNDKVTSASNRGGVNSRQEGKDSRGFVSDADHAVKDTLDQPAMDMANGPQQQDPATNLEHQVKNRLSRLHDSNSCLQQAHSVGTTYGGVSKDPIGPCNLRPNEMNKDGESHRDETHNSLQRENMDIGDNVSETSMVDSLSGLRMSADDVVGIIGLKHFWKARRAIVNQQRVFAVQVFELHRLIKVQKLMAGSPHILLEGSAFLGNSSLKGPSKKLPVDSAVTTVAPAMKQKDDAQKPSNKIEGSAENAVGKPPVPSPQNGVPPSSHSPFLGNPPSIPAPTDTKMTPWCFPHPSGHQWLVPVMSPSEGLIYKPYSMPGFMGPVCGGCGPLGPTPVVGNFMNPGYGFPPYFHEGMGIPSTFSFNSQGYFPPYPVANPAMAGSGAEQMNQVSGCNPNAQIGPNQTSCNMPKQRNGAISGGVGLTASKDSELHGSTASSPGERAEGVMTSPVVGGGDALSLFPTAPQHSEPDAPGRVIRVVPRNARSATESASRILQSIQEERKQHESN
ncbi:Protein EARLY FLOWERING [Ancistrocladus abbreviatus]